MFAGSIPALVTPFRDGAVDFAALERMVDWQVGEGSAALVPCGTTGESATLSYDEHYAVVARVVDVAAKRVPVIAGAGSNDTATALRHLERCAAMGADAALVVAPYYNKPSQEGLARHYETLADASALPIVAYNVPGRTVADLLPETLARIAAHPRVVAIKDASGDLARVTRHRELIGEDFCQLSGNDDLWLSHAVMGGVGCISVTANVAPRLCANFANSCTNNHWNDARVLHEQLFALHGAMFADASPGPAKYALARLHDWMTPEVRLPITEPNEGARAAIDAALSSAGVC